MNYIINIIILIILSSCIVKSPNNIEIEQNISKNDQFIFNKNIEKIYTKDNIKIIFIEDRNNPIISYRLKFKNAGHISDNKNKKAGISSIATMLFNEDVDYDGLSLKEFLAKKAISIDVNNSLDNLYISVDTLSSNLEDSINAVNWIISNNIINKNNLDITKNLLIEFIKYENSDPSKLANREFRKHIYNDHKYNILSKININSIESIKEPDLLNYANEYLIKNNLEISIVGNTNKNQIISAFKNLKLYEGSNIYDENKNNQHEYPNIAKTIIIDKKIPQANIVFGQKINLNKDDYYKAKLLNHIIGGKGLQSRLMNNIRENNGLTYGIYSSIDMHKFANIWSGHTATKNDKVGIMIEKIKEEIDRLRNGDITMKELDLAKIFFIKNKIINLDTNHNLVDFISNVKNSEIDENFFLRRQKKIEDITLDEINDFAKTIIDNNDMTFIIIGDKDLIEKSKI